MKRFANLFVIGGFFFYALTNTGWTRVGTFKTMGACNHAYADFKADPNTLNLLPASQTILGIEIDCYQGS